MADTSSNQLSELLGDKNYKVWAARFKSLLTIKGYASAISSPAAASKPSADAKSEATKTAATVDPEIDSKALALLTLNVKDSNLVHIIDCKTTQEAWDKLKKVQNTLMKARRQELSDQLSALIKKPNEQISSYLARVKDLYMDLQACEASTTEEEAINAALRGLPSAYHTVISVIRVTKVDLTFETLLPMLLAEENLQQSRATKDSAQTAQTVLFASNSSNKGSSSKAFDGKCFHCEQPGHKKSECIDWLKKQLARLQAGDDETCTYCGHKGHSESVCRKKKRDGADDDSKDSSKPKVQPVTLLAF
jgi:hypothetical protein